jgi:hypothetical protein
MIKFLFLFIFKNEKWNLGKSSYSYLLLFYSFLLEILYLLLFNFKLLVQFNDKYDWLIVLK